MTFQRTITIAGGGFSGLCVLAHQVRELKKEWENAGKPNQSHNKTKITIANPAKEIGPGGPYDQELDIYLLNQPAYAMSIYLEDTNNFVRWLQTDNEEASFHELENSFQSRRTYGQYLNETYNKIISEIKELNLPIEIDHQRNKVIDASVNHQNNSVQITANDDSHWTSDSLIIADGHYQNDFLRELSKTPNYFSYGINEEAYNAINQKHNRVLIIGTGQDMMDRLSELHHMNYQGEIFVASRRGVMPWKFDPELYRADREIAPYGLKYFTPENCIKAETYSQLQDLWQNEINYAQENQYGPGHILGAYFAKNEFKNFDAQHPFPNAWKEQAEFIKAFYANPTPPKRYHLLQESKINSIKSGITFEQINVEENGFTVRLDNGQTISIDAIFNSASCARSLRNNGKILSPLIANLDKQGLIEWQKEKSGALNPGQQHNNPIYYAGPYAYSEKWGCETFRAGHKKIATESLQP